MYKDRASQFVGRLKWPGLKVNERGWEIDEFDYANPLYVVLEQDDGLHAASMRLLPITGQNLLNSHFQHLTFSETFRTPDVWECSRFLVSSRASRCAAAGLFVAAGELFVQQTVRTILGLFDQRMLRVYRALKVQPKVICSAGIGQSWLGVGAWHMSYEVWLASMKSLEVDRRQSYSWYLDCSSEIDYFRNRTSNPTSSPVAVDQCLSVSGS